MPIEFSTCLERELVYARWSGHITFDDFVENFERYLGDAHYRPGRPELIDHSDLTGADINYGYAKSMLRQVNAQMGDVKVNTHTVIYAPGGTAFGLSRMYQLLAELSDGIAVEVFDTEREALDALGLPHESIADLLAVETFHPPALKDGSRR